ncbi:hypothetical protein UB46_20910 [Burkholderiaceae bacterium 16]|nr:hypothetical protein UB46_20910 [Burkholderiaceae bacterium 16]
MNGYARLSESANHSNLIDRSAVTAHSEIDGEPVPLVELRIAYAIGGVELLKHVKTLARHETRYFLAGYGKCAPKPLVAIVDFHVFLWWQISAWIVDVLAYHVH